MNYETIKPYIEKGLISENRHPNDADVAIFNYTQRCQFEGAWDEVTKNCRGLILNVATGEVLARPFSKFFNYGEHVSKNLPIPDEIPVVMDKMDGSLGILYALNGEPWIATRGSFISDQAQWATKWWRDHIAMNPAVGETHLFEIIYPQNRIVVNYDYSGLVHLITLDTATGKPKHAFWGGAVREPKTYPFISFEDLAMKNEPNAEGFVLYFPQADIRMKIKFPEYVRLHKLITGVSEIAIWEHLRDGNDMGDLLDKVPDEFYVWVKQVQSRLFDNYNAITHEAQEIVDRVQSLPTRKDQAFNIKKMTDNYSGIVFSLLDGEYKKAQQQAWKMVRPHGKLAFKVDIDL